MTMSSIRPNRVQVVTSVQRCRRWTPQDSGELDSQGGCEICQSNKVDCALACIALG